MVIVIQRGCSSPSNVLSLMIVMKKSTRIFVTLHSLRRYFLQFPYCCVFFILQLNFFFIQFCNTFAKFGLKNKIIHYILYFYFKKLLLFFNLNVSVFVCSLSVHLQWILLLSTNKSLKPNLSPMDMKLQKICTVPRKSTVLFLHFIIQYNLDNSNFD